MGHVDPGNSRIRQAVLISRKAYSVSGPNSLLHNNGHHSLVAWGNVVHRDIDGFSH